MGLGIAVAGLTKTLGGKAALDSVSAVFGAGRLCGIIGPDGAGKTTLLRTIVGLLKADSGSVVFSDGVAAVPLPEVRQSVAYMPQQQSLYPDLSVDEHLEFFRDLYRIEPEVYAARRGALLRMTRLEEFRDRPAGKLSGGMYKKLGLMCSLLLDPRAVLLDEPTNGVDPISRREFWEMLYGLTARGCLVVVTTAYMDEAERCDQVHLMESGKVLAHGEPRAVLDREGVRSFEELFLRRAGESPG